MRSVNLLNWIEHQFLPELEIAMSPAANPNQETIRTFYDEPSIFAVYANVIMINVLEHDRHFNMWSEYSELLALFDSEAVLKEFLGRIVAPHSVGGNLFKEIKDTIDPVMPYVISGGKLFYITK